MYTALSKNKAGYTATQIACGWEGAVMENVTGAFGLKKAEEVIVAKALDGQRYPLPLSVCGCEVVRGAAAPKGPMTYAVLY